MNLKRNFRFGLAELMLVVAIIALSLAPRPAKAQGGTFDAYAGMRTVVVSPPQLIIGGGNNSVTNTQFSDLRVFDGIAKIDLFALTNAAGAVSCQIYTSPDEATWTALANYSLGKQASVIYTNNYYGTNGLTGTNVYILPGSIVNPTAATAGFATPYLDASAPFTNSGAITVVGNRITTIGFRLGEQSRYLQFVWGPSGSATNAMVGAVMTAKMRGGPGAP